MGKKRSDQLPWGSLVKLPKKTDAWYWQYYHRDRGKTITKSCRTADEVEASRIAYTWALDYLNRRDGILPPGVATGGVTLEFAYIKYITASRVRVSERYIEEMNRCFDKYIDPYFGKSTPITEITALQIAEFGVWAKGQGLSADSVNKYLTILSKTLKNAAINGWIETIPFIQRLPVQEVECGYELSDEEIERLLDAAQESPEHVRRFIVLCLYCGLRHSEAVAVRWSDIDWRRGMINLRQKNKTKMPAPLGKARDILGAIPAKDRNGTVVEYRDIIHGGTRPVLHIHRAWRTVRDRAGLPKRVRTHDLRHTFVSRVFRLLGYDARFVSRHKSQDAFIKYLHADRERVFEKVAEAF